MKTMLAAMGAVLVGLMCVGAPSAAEQKPGEMVVAMGYLGAVRTIPRPTPPVATPSPAAKPTPVPTPVPSPPAPTAAPAAFDFSLTNGGTVTLPQSSTGVTMITASLLSGPAQTVSLSASGWPSGVTASFSQGSCALPCFSALTMTTSSSAVAGSYSITVTAGAAGLSRSTTFTVTVTTAALAPAPKPPATPAPLAPAPTSTTPLGGQASPVGYLDVIAADSHAYGWSYDPDASSQSNTVQIYVDGPAGSTGGIFGGQANADRPRPDVNKVRSVSGNHGFDWPIPARFLDGKSHSLYVYGVDLTGNANKALNGSPMTFTSPGSAAPSLTPTPTPSPVTHPQITATLLGQTGEDLVGTFGGTPDGVKDVHIKLSGVSGTIKGVRITGVGGIWEAPANGKNWLVAIRPQSNPAVVDLYIDFCDACKATMPYTLIVTFSDGATQTIQAVSSIPTAAPAIAPAPVATAPAPTPAPIVTTPVAAPAATPAPGVSNSLTGDTSDPGGYSLGFARAHWTGSKMLVFFGNSHNPTGNNSVRAFDPVKSTWEYLWPNECANGICNVPLTGLQNRDNHASLYVPRLDELWVWGGSGLENYGKAIGNPSVLAFCGGRFSVSQKRWLAKGTTADCYGAFSGVVQNFGGFHANLATAWSAEADMGIIFGGSGNGIYDDQWIIEPNPGGSQPYKMSEFLGSRPPARSQAQNLMVAVGSDFYLLGGYAGGDGNGNWTFVNDLWKFSSATRTWTRLPNPPNVNYTPTLTYDSDRHALVAWVNDKIYVYSIASQQWADMTPLGLPCIFNQIGVYAPTAKLHLFEGGNRCSDAGSPGPQVYAVGIGNSAPQPVSAPVPVSTIKATYLGVTGEDKVGQANQTSGNGKADFHVSVSGLRGTPTKVTMTSDTGGVWETPFNSGGNWIVATQYNGQNGDFWFEQFASNKFHVKVRYADGTTDEADATNQVSPTVAAAAPSAIVAPPTPPTPAPTPVLATTPTPTSPPPVAGWLNIPLRTWVSRPFPPAQLEARNEFIGQRGYGVDASKGAKHQRLVYNPGNKRVYFYAGDYFVPPFSSSFHTDMFSYDITKYTDDASDAQNWILEWPYCGLPGQITPIHMDETAFAWDSRRNLFWLTAGSEVGSQDVVNMCGNGAIFYGSSAISASNPSGNAQHGFDILQFDPSKNRYMRPDAKYQLIPSSLKGSSQMPRHSVYNSVTDEIFMFGQGISGNVVFRMNAETGVWAVDALVCDDLESNCTNGGGYINDVFTIHEQPALDVEHQLIYLIDTYHKQDPDPNHRFRLVRYDIAHHNMVSLGWIHLPDFGDPLKFPFYMPPYDSTMLAYDPINKVVLWPASSNEGRPILMIYHPDATGGKNGTWEIDPMNRDKPNEVVFGSNGTFIPELNALVIFGGFGKPNSDFFAAYPGFGAPENYFWLYRYGNGK